jgi:hypothetical protein
LKAKPLYVKNVANANASITTTKIFFIFPPPFSLFALYRWLAYLARHVAGCDRFFWGIERHQVFRVDLHGPLAPGVMIFGRMLAADKLHVSGHAKAAERKDKTAK